MKPVAALDKYLEVLDLGKSQEEAYLFASSWAQACELHPEAATKTDLKNAIEALEKDLKIFFGYLVGGTIIVTVLIPIVLRYLNVI